MPKIISRAEAREQGLTKYFTGKPCKNGHLEERNTHSGNCYSCQKELSKKFYQTDKGKESTRISQKKYLKTDKGKEAQKRGSKKFRSSDKGKEYYKEYRQSDKGKEQKKIYHKKYYNSEKGKKTRKNHYENVLKEFMKMDEWRERQSKYKRKERENPITRFLYNYRTRINEVLKKTNTVKNQTTINLLGCNTNFFIKYLEKLFEKNMKMKNYGEWHLDHIVPLNYFVKNYDMNDENTVQIAFHYSNLQPMWAKKNIIKSDKISKQVAEKKIAEIKKLIKN